VSNRDLTPQPTFPEISKYFWTAADLIAKSQCRIAFHEYRLDQLTGSAQEQQAHKRKKKRDAAQAKDAKQKESRRQARASSSAAGAAKAKKKSWGGKSRWKKKE